MDNPEVARYIEALKNKDVDVRFRAINSLVEIGNPAIPALIEALNSEDCSGRYLLFVTQAIGEIGDASAVPFLIEALKDKNVGVRNFTVQALGRIGDAHILPRKILAQPHLLPQQRIDRLDALRKVSYQEEEITLRYEFPNTRTLSQTVLMEEDDDARVGAQEVLDYLDAKNIIDASESRPKYDNTETPISLTLWQRLFGKQTDDS